MIKVHLTFILLFFVSLASFSQSWKELNDSLIRFYNNGEFEEGIIVGEKAVIAAKKQFGENHANYARSLNNLGELYYVTGQYEKAEPLYIQSKEIRKKVLGETHPDYARSLNSLGELYHATGQYEKAEPLYIQSIEIRKKELGENHRDYATSLYNLAELYESMSQYEKAEPLYIQSIEIRKKVFGEANPEYFNSLNSLALLYQAMAKYEKAESLFIKSKEITREVLGETHPDYATSLNNLGLFYLTMGQNEKAEPLYKQAAAIDKKALGEEDPSYAGDLNGLAGLYANMGQYEKAEPLFIQAIKILKKALGETHPNYATALNNLAGLYVNMGQYEKAEPLFINVKEIRKNVLGETHPDYAGILNNMAEMYQAIGQYEKAETLLIQARIILKKVLGETHPDYATILNSLALLYETMGQYEKVEPLLLQAKEIKKKVFGEDHIDYAFMVNNLAIVYSAAGQYEKAESLYIRANEIFKKVLGETHPTYAVNLDNLAALFQSMGQYEKAESLYLQAKAILKTALGETHPDYSTNLNNLVILYQDMGQYEKAEPLFLQNNHIVLQNLLNNFTILSEKEKGIYINNNVSFLEISNSFIYNYKKASSAILQNNFNQQLILKSLTLTDTRNVLNSIRQNPDTTAQRLLKDWLSSKSILAKQYSLPIINRRADIKEIETQAENLEKELNRKSTAFRSQQQALQIKMNDVQKGLQPDEAAIEFVSFRLYNKKWTDSIIYAAYILRKNDSITQFVPLFEEKQLQQLLDNAGRSATNTAKIFYRGLEIRDKNTKQGAALYELIWKPLESYLKGIKKVVYSPAGKLYGIAFHALPVDSTTLLMDKYQLEQYTSTRQVALRAAENHSVKPAGIVLFGDANFSMDSLELSKQRIKQSNKNISTSIYMPSTRSANNNSWPALPGTAEEVKKIAELFNGNKITSKTFTKTNASEENLKSLNSNSPQILHIATHGFFLPEPDKKRKERMSNQDNTYALSADPLLRSGLILAAGNYAWSGKTPINGVEDGIATAYEISQLDLSNTELVVLSACETALGDVKGSEGVFGLQRAFKMAGVKKMIVSLWQVPDKETAELMTSFYSYWMKGKNINESFTQAQADMRKKYSPFYWAAFVLVK